VQQARAAGLSDEAIQGLARQQGLKFGDQAAQSLNVSAADRYQPPAPKPVAYTGAPAANYQPSGSLSSFVNLQGGGTSGAMGATAVGKAMAAGLSADQIKRQAAAQGMTFGPAALAILR